MPKSKERCKEIREEMKNTIIKKSMLYFAKNGFSGTKIGDLAKSIGIGQGTIYVYFESKEDLFKTILGLVDNSHEIKELKLVSELPISASKKLHMISKSVLHKLENDETFAAMIALNPQIMMDKNQQHSSIDTIYKSDIYKHTAKIIEKGQKEGSMTDGSPIKLADYYWSVIYLYALKRLYTTEFDMISVEDLNRTVMKGE